MIQAHVSTGARHAQPPTEDEREEVRVLIMKANTSAALYWLAVLVTDLIRSFIGYAVVTTVVRWVQRWRHAAAQPVSPRRARYRRSAGMEGGLPK